MGHARKEIRDAFVSILTAAATSAGSKIYKSRVLPVWTDEELPAILVYCSDETANVYNEAPRTYERTLRVSLEAIAKAADNVDDALDAIAAQIETAIDNNRYLYVSGVAYAADTELAQTSLQFSKEGEKPLGAVRLVYSVTYYTASPADISVNGDRQDLKTVGATWHVQGGELSDDPGDGDLLQDELGDLDQ